MMFDTIADMLTRIRNSNQRLHKNVLIPFSKTKNKIAEILKEEGYIEKFTIEGEIKKILVVSLKYKRKQKVISGIKRISKPGLRIYVSSKKIKKVLNGLGISIITTNKGIMTGELAKKLNLGGEVIAHVW